MNPYIRKIVELHKIHEAIENKSNSEGGGNGNSGGFDLDTFKQNIDGSYYWYSTEAK